MNVLSFNPIKTSLRWQIASKSPKQRNSAPSTKVRPTSALIRGTLRRTTVATALVKAISTANLTTSSADPAAISAAASPEEILGVTTVATSAFHPENATSTPTEKAIFTVNLAAPSADPAASSRATPLEATMRQATAT